MIACAALLGCTTPQPQASDIDARPPDTLRYEIGNGLSGGKTTYEVKGDFIVKKSSNTANRYSDQSSLVMRRKPSTSDWRNFWREVEPLRLWEWKKIYDTSDLEPRILVSDGSSWAFSCRHGSRRMKSSGYASFPELGHPQITTLDYTTFSHFEQAFDHLLDPPMR